MKKVQNKNSKISLAKKLKYLPLVVMLGACSNTFDKLQKVGKEPELQTVSGPIEQASYTPISWPTPVANAPYQPSPNSLWQEGSRSFFKDGRASRVGDILTVNVRIDDSADLSNKTTRDRTNTEDVDALAFLGLQEKFLKVTPGNPSLNDLVNLNSTTNNEGDGSIEREEEINARIAAVVTQVLPNGNLVIHGTQEVRVNFEKRQVSIAGIIRPSDIDATNMINSDQIAEARIAYGGEGTLSELQQPRYGHQIVEILSPF